MGVLSSGSWTVAFRTDRSQDVEYGKRKKAIELKLTTVSGSPPVGSKLPLPGAGSVGMTRNLDRYEFDNRFFASGTIAASGASGAICFTYSPSGNSITFQRFRVGTGAGSEVSVLSTKVVLKAMTLYVTARGW